MKLVRQWSESLVVVLLVASAVAVYAVPYWQLRPDDNRSWVYNTPDEAANYFFADRLVREGTVRYPETRNEISERQIIHPRSTTVVGGDIVPGSFLGFILILEAWAKVFGPAVLPFVTPLMAGAGLVAWYGLMRRWRGARFALVSTLLLATLPGWWYYASRSLFGNVSFASCLIISSYYLQRHLDRRDAVSLVVAGAFTGLALMVRTGDVIWVAALWAWLVLPQIGWRRGLAVCGLGAAAALAMFGPVFVMQHELFGSWLTTGYVPEGSAVIAGARPLWLALIQQLTLPFGLHPRAIVYTLYQYLVIMQWWYVVPALLAWLALMSHWARREPFWQWYGIAMPIIGVLVTLLYGSWLFHNNLLGQALIGSSQVRYFLPLTILLVPLVTWGMIELTQMAWSRWRIIALTALIGLSVSLSYWRVVTAGPESLTAVVRTVRGYYDLQATVATVTPPEAIIITSYHDKVFFPQRAVASYWQYPEAIADITKLVETGQPTYLYRVAAVEGALLEQQGHLTLDLVVTTTPTEALYRLGRR